MLKGYRTIVFNAIMLLVMVASQAGWLTPEQVPDSATINLFLDNLDGVLTVLWGIGNIALRFVTNTPALQKE